jgi:hypothetical protein
LQDFRLPTMVMLSKAKIFYRHLVKILQFVQDDKITIFSRTSAVIVNLFVFCIMKKGTKTPNEILVPRVNPKLCRSLCQHGQKMVLDLPSPVQSREGFFFLAGSSFETQHSTNFRQNVSFLQALDMPPPLFADSGWGAI